MEWTTSPNVKNFHLYSPIIGIQFIHTLLFTENIPWMRMQSTLSKKVHDHCCITPISPIEGSWNGEVVLLSYRAVFVEGM